MNVAEKISRLLYLRNKYLLKKPPIQNCCNKSLILRDWFHYPCVWKCDICNSEYIYEPGPKDVPIIELTLSLV